MRRKSMLVLVLAVLVGTTVLVRDARALSDTREVVGGLESPAMFTIAGDGRIFYSELRTGRIGVFNPLDGSHSTYFTVPDVCTSPWNDQGLYGLALHPGYPQTPDLYAYATRRSGDGSCRNEVLRITRNSLGEFTVAVLLSDPYTYAHVGGRLLFGPDGNLYVSTGDGASGAPTAELENAAQATAQDTSSVKGKILRMTSSGAVPADNPFGNHVFAYGFRNVFGSAFDPASGRLWATDNGPDPSYADDPRGPGPSGGCNDEVNLVVRGANYGWGSTGSCAKPPPAPQNTNQDGPAPVLPATYIEAASGITGAAFCFGCGLGSDLEGRLLYVKWSYWDGSGEIRAATLDADRSTVINDVAVLRPAGGAPLSIERGPDGALYYSDDQRIVKLVATPSTGVTSTTVASTTTRPSSGAPTGLRVTSRTPSTVGLSWNAVAGASEYRAYVSRTSGSGYFLWAAGFTGTSATLYSLTGDYHVVMRAVVDGVESPNSNEVLAAADGTVPPSTVTTTSTTSTTPPASRTPTNLTATSRTASTVGLSWNAVAGATEYRAYVSQTSGSGYFLWAAGFTGTSATLYSLTGDYYVVMRAVVDGVESPNSNEVRASADGTVPPSTVTTTSTTSTTPPASRTPTNLTATSRTASTVGLTWSPVAGASEYRAYVSRTSGSGYFLWAAGFTGTSATLYSLTGDYYVVMRAVVDGVESPNSNEVRASADGTVPPSTVTTTAPTDVTATSRTASTVGLTWSPVAGASEYRAYVSRTSGSGHILWASGFTGTSATLYSLTGDYYVVMRAVVDGVESPNSNEVLASAP